MFENHPNMVGAIPLPSVKKTERFTAAVRKHLKTEKPFEAKPPFGEGFVRSSMTSRHVNVGVLLDAQKKTKKNGQGQFKNHFAID